MITEDYVSFETAKLLKEKGFDEATIGYYPIVGKAKETFHKGAAYRWNYFSDRGIAAPTLQMAMKWLREVHKLGVFSTTYYREINRNIKHDYGSTIVRLDTYEVIGNGKNIEDYTFEAETYEETADKAIRYCLENLI
jgi:hypothetical protein